MTMDIEAEILDLKRRVTELEGSFGFLTNQVKAVHTDLLAFQKTTLAFQKETLAFQTTTIARFDRLESGFESLRHDLPDIIATAVGTALRR